MRNKSSQYYGSKIISIADKVKEELSNLFVLQGFCVVLIRGDKEKVHQTNNGGSTQFLALT